MITKTMKIPKNELVHDGFYWATRENVRGIELIQWDGTFKYFLSNSRFGINDYEDFTSIVPISHTYPVFTQETTMNDRLVFAGTYSEKTGFIPTKCTVSEKKVKELVEDYVRNQLKLINTQIKGNIVSRTEYAPIQNTFAGFQCIIGE